MTRLPPHSLVVMAHPAASSLTRSVTVVYQTYGGILLEDRFRPAGFAAPLGPKDMTLVDTAATSFGVPMLLLGIVRDHLRSVIATDGPNVDWAGIALAVRKSAKI